MVDWAYIRAYHEVGLNGECVLALKRETPNTLLRDIFITLLPILFLTHAMDSPSAFRLYSDSELFTSSPEPSSTNFDQTSYTHQSYLPSLRTQLSFDQAKTTIQDTVRFEPRDGQVEALLHLYHGRDYVLVAPCGWGKTLVITGLPLLYPPDIPSIILIVSPLKSIQQDQSSALQKELGDRFKPFVLDGNSNTAENRMKIATGVYTHVWLSAEVAIGYVGKEGEKRKKKKVRFPCGYQDDGEFLSVLLHDACMLFYTLLI